jgi:DNA polymerase-3 subunit beta
VDRDEGDKTAVMGKFLVPTKALVEVLRALGGNSGGDGDGGVRVTASADRVLFELEGMKVVSRRLSGNFPNYQRAMPSMTDTKWDVYATVGAKEMGKVLGKARVYADERSHAVRLSVRGESGLEVMASRDGEGEYRTVVAAEDMYVGDAKFVAGYNADYLIDFCRAFDVERLALYMVKGEGTVVVPATQPEGMCITGVVMPMRT